MIERMHGTSFDWLTWSGGWLIDLGLKAQRFQLIKDNSDIIRQYAVGYCDGESLLCRPKLNEIAVMFLKDDKYFWTHIRKEEFEYLFMQIEKPESKK